VDTEVANPSVGTQTRPLVHQWIINIQNGDFSTGKLPLRLNMPCLRVSFHVELELLHDFKN